MDSAIKEAQIESILSKLVLNHQIQINEIVINQHLDDILVSLKSKSIPQIRLIRDRGQIIGDLTIDTGERFILEDIMRLLHIDSVPIYTEFHEALEQWVNILDEQWENIVILFTSKNIDGTLEKLHEFKASRRGYFQKRPDALK